MNKFAKEWLPTVGLILLLFAARSSLADHYYVPTGSMEFTLLPGDRVIVDKTTYGIELPFTHLEFIKGDRPTPGEIAVFDSPRDGKRLIKRIVAVGRDIVAVKNGVVYRNGTPQTCNTSGPTECYDARTARLRLDGGGGPDLGPVLVPPGKVLVVGDARGHSFDGRYFGFIDESALYGRALGVYYRRGSGLLWRAL